MTDLLLISAVRIPLVCMAYGDISAEDLLQRTEDPWVKKGTGGWRKCLIAKHAFEEGSAG